MNLIIQLIVGGIIGWLASIVMKTNAQMGLIANVIVGIVGSVIGTSHVAWWTAQPALQPVSVVTAFGPWTALAMSLALFGGITWFTRYVERRAHGRQRGHLQGHPLRAREGLAGYGHRLAAARDRDLSADGRADDRRRRADRRDG